MQYIRSYPCLFRDVEKTNGEGVARSKRRAEQSERTDRALREGVACSIQCSRVVTAAEMTRQ